MRIPIGLNELASKLCLWRASVLGMLIFKVLLASLVLVVIGLVLQRGDHFNIFYKNYFVKATYQMMKSNKALGESPSCHGRPAGV
jgi:hypothetical protein